MVRLLLERPNKYLEETDNYGLTPLAQACSGIILSSKDLDIIDQLIQAGADVSVKNRSNKPITQISAEITMQIEKSLARLNAATATDDPHLKSPQCR